MDIVTLALCKKEVGKGTAEAVSAYLDEHLTNPTDPPIDTSLSIAGAAADAKETGDKITQLKEDLNTVIDATTNPVVVTINKTSTGVTEYEQRGYYNAKGQWTANNSYVMYYFTMPDTADIWIDITGSDKFCELNVFSDSLFGTSVLFARSTRSEIPTENNKATIQSGHIVSVVITVSGTEYRDFNFNYYDGIEIKVDNTLRLQNVPADAKMVGDLLIPLTTVKKQCCIYRPVVHEEGNPNLDNQIYYSDKVTDNVLSVFYPAKDGYIQFNLGRSYRDIEGGYDVWRMCVLYAADENFAKRFEITRPGEWEMAVKIRGDDDFIGGYEHGDEYQTEVSIYVDGELIDVNTLTDYTEFDELKIRVVSNMFSPADHVTLVGIHGKEWKFADGKAELTQSIQWLVENDTEMTASYMTMFPAIRGNDANSEAQITSKYYDDVNFVVRDCATYGFDGTLNADTRKATLYSPESGIAVTVEVLEYPDYPNSKFAYISNGENKANKIYYGVCGKGATYGTVSNGTVWKSKSIYKIEIANGTAGAE